MQWRYEMLRQAVSLLFGLSLAVLVGGEESSAQSISIFGNAIPNNPSRATPKRNPDLGEHDLYRCVLHVQWAKCLG